MKFTKKQLKKAVLEWYTDVKLRPSSVMPDEIYNKTDVADLAEHTTDYLIDLINK